MITLGISQALSVLVSEANSANNISQVMEYRKSANRLAVVLFVFVLLVFLFMPGYLMSLFTNASTTVHVGEYNLCRMLFLIAAFAIPMDSFRNIISGYLRGLEDSITPMRIGLLCLWFISLPLSYLFGFVFHQGPVGLRFGFAIGIFISAVIMWLKVIAKEKPLMESGFAP